MRTLLAYTVASLLLAPGAALAQAPLPPQLEPLTDAEGIAARWETSAQPRVKLSLTRRPDAYVPPNAARPYARDGSGLSLGAEYRVTKSFSVEAEVFREDDELVHFLKNGFTTGERERGSSYSFNPFSEQILRFKYTF